MEWATEKPTVEGYYWVYVLERSGHFKRLVQLRRACPACELRAVFRIGDGKAGALDNFTHFIGPLPEPEAPETP